MQTHHSGHFPDPRSSRPTVAEINLPALRFNLECVRSLVGKRHVMAVVKANAYGHGLVRVAHELAAAGVDQLGVAFVEEGVELRRAGISLPILVLGGIIGEQVSEFIKHDLSITASSVWKLNLVEATARAMGRRATIHLKLDTGMERLGIHHYNAAELFEAAVQAEHCELAGVFSHLAAADAFDPAFTQLQLRHFEEATSWFPRHGLPMPPRHLANSAAILRHPATHFDMVRPGLMLYGLDPASELPSPVKLLPVLELKTRVVYFKVVPAGSTVGYDRTWTAPAQTRIVTLPVGYGDGYRRAFSNRAKVLIRGHRHDVVGAVSMDQITVNVGWSEAFNDEEVVLLGGQGSENIGAHDLACWADTIAYEILTGINTRVPRVYLDNALK